MKASAAEGIARSATPPPMCASVIAPKGELTRHEDNFGKLTRF